MKVRVYVEGGGDSKDLRILCRRGFSKLFERAGLKGRMPKVAACGSRNQAFRSFRISAENGRKVQRPVASSFSSRISRSGILSTDFSSRMAAT